MTNHIEEADNAQLRLWETLEKKGYLPITYQFPRWEKKGDVLTHIRSALREYLENSKNFYADGSL